MARGTLRIFLGAAPRVSRGPHLLQEAHRLGVRGEDVAVAHSLRTTAAPIRRLSWTVSRSSRHAAFSSGASSLKIWIWTPSWPGPPGRGGRRMRPLQPAGQPQPGGAGRAWTSS